MNSGFVDGLLSWVELHPTWAGLLVFLVAFIESLAVVGILIPGVFILFGIGALIGLESLDFYAIWLWASLGAFLGDSLSYWLGYRYREQLAAIWPFRKFPDALDKGRQFIAKHGTKSILLGRFIGPLRPIVPATAGMLGMRPKLFLGVDTVAAITWSPAYLLPGVLFGASLEVAAEYAGRLAVVVAVLVAAIWLSLWLVRVLYEWAAGHSGRWLGSAIRWSHRHPVIGRFTGSLLDPSKPEVLSVAMLGISLVVAFWALIVLLIVTPARAVPLAMDQWTASVAINAHSYLTDPAMAYLSRLSDWYVLFPVSAIFLIWLLLLKRVRAAAHWGVAIAGAIALQWLLQPALQQPTDLADWLPRSLNANDTPMVLATTVYGYFAVMIAKDLRRKYRRWPYLIAAALIVLLVMAQLYSGTDRASGLLTQFFLGGCWVALMGLAYRQRARDPYGAGVPMLLFYGTLAAAVVLVQPARVAAPDEHPAPQRQSATLTGWLDRQWQQLPENRTRFGSRAARRFNIQMAGDIEQVRERLMAQGWQTMPELDWSWLLQMLNPRADRDSLDLPSRYYLGQPESLRLYRPLAGNQRVQSLRLWYSGLELEDGSAPVYLGQLYDEQITPRLKVFRYWRARTPNSPVEAGLIQSLGDARTRRTENGTWLIYSADRAGR